MRLGRDHADDRDAQLGLELRQRRRGRRVAGDDDQLHVLRLEVAADLAGEAAYLLERPRAVREPRVVAEVDEVLVREGDEALVEHGQPADARVEHPDRPRVHRRSLRGRPVGIRSTDEGARAHARPECRRRRLRRRGSRGRPRAPGVAGVARRRGSCRGRRDPRLRRRDASRSGGAPSVAARRAAVPGERARARAAALRRLPRRAAARAGGGRVGAPELRARGRLVPGRADGGRARRSRPGLAPAPVRRVPVAPLHVRAPGRRRRARTERASARRRSGWSARTGSSSTPR